MAVIKKTAAAAASTVALAGALTALTAAPAHAASYNGACGSGYSVLASHNLPGGTIFLTYNSSNGYNCVVTVRNSPGAAIHMNAVLAVYPETTWTDDPGDYTTYAGPVKRYAADQCIAWGGKIGDVWWSSPNWEFCS